MNKISSGQVCILTFILSIFISTFSHSSDFSYEIRDPRASSADDYLSTSGVATREEQDFVYWYPSSATAPNELIFHFHFDQTIKEADLYFRTDTFNWGNDAYTTIEASSDGINWLTLKETGPPAENDGWNNGTYSGSLPIQLLGEKDIYIKGSLSVYRDGVRRAGIYAQALRYQKSINNLTFRFNATLATPNPAATPNSAATLPAIPMLLLQPTEETVRLDPVAIGGTGTEILYKGKLYSTSVSVKDNALIGIQKGDNYYLYHQNLGNNVTFSDETNKKAIGFALMALKESDIQQTAIQSQTDLPETTALAQAQNNSVLSSQHATLSTGVDMMITGSTIKLTNNKFRWVAVDVHKKLDDVTTETTTYFLAPTSITTDSWDFFKTVMPELNFSGDTVSFDTNDVFQIEVHGAVARGLPSFLASSWPSGAEEAYNNNYDLVIDLNTLDLLYIVTQLLENTVDVLSIECIELVITPVKEFIKAVLFKQLTSDERIDKAILAGLGAQVSNSYVNCIATAATVGTYEVVSTIWDIVKTANWLFEDIFAGSYDIIYLDAYNKIDIVTIDDLTVHTPPRTIYTEGEPLDLTDLTLKLTYSSEENINYSDIYLQYNYNSYQIRGISSSLPDNYVLTSSDTSIQLTLPQQDLSIINAYTTDNSVILAHSDSSLIATQSLTVKEDTTGTEGPCNSPVTANSITFPGYQGEGPAPYSVTISFPAIYKMCTKEIDDPNSMNNKTTMLFFYLSDESGTYSTPNYQENSASASVSSTDAYELSSISISPLPDYNNYTYKDLDPENQFFYEVHNYDGLSSNHDGDFFWVNTVIEIDPIYNETLYLRTIVNTEFLEADGSYTGDYNKN